MKHPYGALKAKIDTRDYRVKAGAMQFPASYTCEYLPPIKDQKDVCSCVAHATSSILESFNMAETNTNKTLSTNFIYGMQGIAFDQMGGGMYLRDACKIVKDYGDPLNETISGNTEQPFCSKELGPQLNDKVYAEAKKYRVKTYAKCKTANDLRYALMYYGPVLVSIPWYDKYTIEPTGLIHMNEETGYGYHAVMVYGWNEDGWLCQNSWGDNWGKEGRFIYPYTSKFAEAWSFVDEDNSTTKKKATTGVMDIIYKMLNILCNNIFKLIKF